MLLCCTARAEEGRSSWWVEHILQHFVRAATDNCVCVCVGLFPSPYQRQVKLRSRKRRHPFLDSLQPYSCDTCRLEFLVLTLLVFVLFSASVQFLMSSTYDCVALVLLWYINCTLLKAYPPLNQVIVTHSDVVLEKSHVLALRFTLLLHINLTSFRPAVVTVHRLIVTVSSPKSVCFSVPEDNECHDTFCGQTITFYCTKKKCFTCLAILWKKIKGLKAVGGGN